MKNLAEVTEFYYCNIGIMNNKSNWRLKISYFLLICAYTQASLRLSDSGSTVVFRWLVPIGLLFIIRESYNSIVKVFRWFLIYCVYNVLMSYVFYSHIEISSYIFVFFMLCVYIFVEHIANHSYNFNDSFYKFLDIVTVVICILSFFQHRMNFVFPHIQTRYQGMMYLFFWNENELSAAISCVAIIYFYRFLYKKEKLTLVKCLFIYWIVYENDAKLSLIGVVMGTAFLLFRFFIDKYGSNKSYKFLLKVAFAFVSIICIVTAFNSDYQIHFSQYDMSLNKLIGSSIKSILELKPQVGAGSIQVRSDAIIYGIIELKKSFLFGIGCGNATYMLTFSQYHLATAKSMHNFIFKFITESGYFAFAVIYFIIKKINIESKIPENNEITILRIGFIIAFIFISSQSSDGIMSNYMLWSVIYYVILLRKTNEEVFQKAEC